ncbi:MAG: PAS domain-containing protein [Desulfomonile tiedjei]|nr:PAS domain-containing protein [Desulfomonile tiedjei]
MAKRATSPPPKAQSAAKKTKTAASPKKKAAKANLPVVRPAAKRPKKLRNAAVAESAANFPIVGVGASAGGLEAFQLLFNNMPPDTGMAFVLVQHLDPTRKSILVELIRRYTRMKVVEVEDGMKVTPDTVFVIPPNSYMATLNGKLHLFEPPAPTGHRMPIDFFFRSLAEDQKERAICVVLSGTGTEGTLGLRAVKGEGGMCMVQEPESAKYDGMPRSAISTGMVDYILPPDKMPRQLAAYVEHAFGPGRRKRVIRLPHAPDLLEKIFIAVRTRTGHDFSDYKRSAVLRRIQRRLAVHQLDNLKDYLSYVQNNPQESETLFREFLIGVTNFFRDPDAFEVLKNPLTSLLKKRGSGQPVRIWVPGCATGEEAYSIAMILREVMDKLKKNFAVQIFATDISATAVETARRAMYLGNISIDVPPERLKRFFVMEDNSYRVSKDIRDMIVFAVQDVTKDPPFSKIDLISCRNLLIYFEQELQKKVLWRFHYSLIQEGLLFLGGSESVDGLVNVFPAVDRKSKIFRHSYSPSRRVMIEFEVPPVIGVARSSREEAPAQVVEKISYREWVEKTMLENYSPAGVIVDEKSDIVYVHGRTGKYLEPASGQFRGNVVDMAREGLKLELAHAMRKAASEGNEVRCAGLRVKTNGVQQLINLVVKRIEEPPPMKGLLMVVFEDLRPETTEEEGGKTGAALRGRGRKRIQELEHELRSTREYLQTTIEELESSNEELKSTNEELQSSNEELQSTNEELETSKEELQSLNEELVTVNAELQQKIDELSEASGDMANLLASTGIGTIFLDINFNIRRFTPTIKKIINLIPTDVGRPVSHIASNLNYGDLVEDAENVLNTLVPKEAQVKAKDGKWHLMRIMPYRTLDDVIDGIVVTFTDITALKEMEQAAQCGREMSEAIVNTVHEPLLVLDEDLRVISANHWFYRSFQVTAKETEGKRLYDLGNRQWDIPALRDLLEKILPKKTVVEDFRVEHEFETIGKRVMLVNARCLEISPEFPQMILMALEDISEKKSNAASE